MRETLLKCTTRASSSSKKCLRRPGKDQKAGTRMFSANKSTSLDEASDSSPKSRTKSRSVSRSPEPPLQRRSLGGLGGLTNTPGSHHSSTNSLTQRNLESSGGFLASSQSSQHLALPVTEWQRRISDYSDASVSSSLSDFNDELIRDVDPDLYLTEDDINAITQLEGFQLNDDDDSSAQYVPPTQQANMQPPAAVPPPLSAEHQRQQDMINQLIIQAYAMTEQASSQPARPPPNIRITKQDSEPLLRGLPPLDLSQNFGMSQSVFNAAFAASFPPQASYGEGEEDQAQAPQLDLSFGSTLSGLAGYFNLGSVGEETTADMQTQQLQQSQPPALDLSLSSSLGLFQTPPAEFDPSLWTTTPPQSSTNLFASLPPRTNEPTDDMHDQSQ